MQVDIYKKLAQQITNNPYFSDPEDCSVLIDVVQNLDMDHVQHLSDVNRQFQKQVRMESAMVYLMGKYDDTLTPADKTFKEISADLLLKIPEKGEDGKKYTVADREAILTLDPGIQEAQGARDALKSLSRDLTNLYKVIMSRNSKLENLSANYRRELKMDERTE